MLRLYLVIFTQTHTESSAYATSGGCLYRGRKPISYLNMGDARDTDGANGIFGPRLTNGEINMPSRGKLAKKDTKAQGQCAQVAKICKSDA